MTRWHILHRNGRLFRRLGKTAFDRRICKLTERAIEQSLVEISEELARRFA